MQNIESLVRDHVAALNEGDLDNIMSHYHANASIVHQQGIANGYDEIRGLFEFFVSGILIPGKTEFDLQVVNAVADIGYIVWSAESPTFSIPLATDTFVFDEGLIVQQTTAGVMNSKD